MKEREKEEVKTRKGRMKSKQGYGSAKSVFAASLHPE
jgi:hypothetical protein